jgi:hypothetical protein
LKLIALVITILAMLALLKPAAAPPPEPASPVVVNIQSIPNHDAVREIVEQKMRDHNLLEPENPPT